jgi:CDP-diacylglycerol--glycerol-3-phosphate 3-phosphatidyltransferase
MIARRSIPNLLTGARIVGALAVFALMAGVAGGAGRPLATVAFVVFALSALTDFFDGWLARRLNVTSAWGAALDPIADKIAALAAILGLTLAGGGLAVAVPGALILFREVFVSGLREAGAGRGVKLPVTQLAKWKTTLQLVALSLALLAVGLASQPVAWGAEALLWVAAAATLLTGAQYAAAFTRAAS